MASSQLQPIIYVKYFCAFHSMSELEKFKGYWRCPVCGWLKGKGVVSVEIPIDEDDLPSTSSGIHHEYSYAVSNIADKEKYLLLIRICCGKLSQTAQVQEQALTTAKMAVKQNRVTGIPQPMIAAAAMYLHMPRHNSTLQIISEATGQNSRAIVATSHLMRAAALEKGCVHHCYRNF